MYSSSFLCVESTAATLYIHIFGFSNLPEEGTGRYQNGSNQKSKVFPFF